MGQQVRTLETIADQTLALLRAGQLAGTRRLNLAAGLTTFPAEILGLADSLEVLDLSNNALTTLPDSFARLHNLRVAFFNNNAFEVVPEVLAQCPKLSMIGFKANRVTTVPMGALPLATRWLILTDNRVTSLPESMGDLPHLQKLMLAGNRLRALPETMAACRQLELMRLAANQLEHLPPWLLSLPRLSWLAYAGNPFCAAFGSSRSVSLPQIPWADLGVGEVLGQGASGIISQGRWQQAGGETAVAIKIFKGTMTSDGLPLDEIRACIAAGSHPNLIGPLGQIAEHPQQKNGLILPLVPPTYGVMAGPPSLESCTRDTYAPDRRFSLGVALGIAKGVAAAAAHLHQRGILHGDLYPHNTLIDPRGKAYLTDFGAASFYDPGDRAAQWLERMEVRAFGCLLEDLCDRISPDPDNGLRQLQHRCLQPEVLARPTFRDLLAALDAIPPA